MIYDFDKIVSREHTHALKVDACKNLFGKDDLIPLWVADMDFECPDFVINALKDRLEHPILGYTCRPKSFFKSVQSWVKRRNNWDIEPSDLSFSPGIVPAINFSVLAFTQPGDTIIVNTPVYHPFMYAVNDHKRHLVYNSLLEVNGVYSIDYTDLENKLAQNAKMLIFCNPHNPVGRVWTKAELQRVGDLCVKYNTLLIADEIHSDLVFKPHKHTHIASISPEIAKQTLTFLAPSKTFNLAGVATAIVHSTNPEYLAAFNQQVDVLHLSMGNLFGNIALETAYTHGDAWLDQLLAYLSINFDIVESALSKHCPKIKMHKPEGTYLIWLDCRALGLSSDELKDFFTNKAGIALNPGDLFGIEGTGFMRLNAASPHSVIEKAMEQLKTAYQLLATK